MAVDSWAAAPTAQEKAITFRVAEGIRWTEIGTNSIVRILQGTVAVIFGVAIVKSMLLRRWIGRVGVFVGAVTIIAGVEVAYVGFASSQAGVGVVSLIIYSIWVGILGGLMWRKAMSKSNQKI
jgi:Na+/melibiose symporter-like transporter